MEFGSVILIAAIVLVAIVHAIDRLVPRKSTPMTPGGERTRICVIGGGFAGVYTAKYLEELLAEGEDFHITLINRDNYFVFQPMLPEVISGTIGILDTVTPIRHLLKRTEFAARDVERIDLEKKIVVTAPGFQQHTHDIPFDHLVLALGTVTDFRGLTGLPEHALPFKNLADALHVRNHVIRALEEADIEFDQPELRKQLLTFVVAGGGFSGIEVCAELNDFVRGVARNYPHIDPEELRVILIHSQDRILPEVSEKLARFAEKLMRKRGVELLLKTRLAAATGKEAVLADGTRIPTRTLISTVPSSPHPLVDSLPFAKEKGKFKVDAQLKVEGTDSVWALGDCALVPAPEGGFAPPTAQHAIREADVVAHNIVAQLRGAPMRKFGFRGLGKMGALGRRSAVAEILGMNFSGFVAWFIWRTIYLMKMPGWGRRLKVAASWTFDLFLPPELVQLRLEGSSGVTREHFEPGQTVFEQGDVGDRIYILLNGAAEVVRRESDGSERTLAQLGMGEAFGEMALLSGNRRNATVRCTKAMDVLCLPKREFSLLAAQLPEVRHSFEAINERRTTDRSPNASDGGLRT